MAWFSKPRSAEPVAPGLCARCGTRPGTTLVRFVPGADGGPLGRAARTAWLCDLCRQEVGRDAADN